MTPLHLLWLPIVLSAIAVFVASSIIHMASPWHKSDYPPLSNEAAVLDALRPLSLPPGDYMMPRPKNMDDMKSQEFADKRNRGPVVLMTVMPNGTMKMGAIFVQWFIYLLVVTLLAAVVACSALAPDAHDHTVFHIVGLTAFAGYSLALVQLSIWYSRSWSITMKTVVDGLIYAVITALIFTWLWPR